MKTRVIPLAVLALAACSGGQASDKKYQQQVVKMTCGDAHYTLTSSCIKSEDDFELNECKPQSLLVERAGTKRLATLPELPPQESRRITTSGGTLKDLFVVRWACSKASAGPVATFYYSIGGGSAEYGESWTHYDKAGKLIVTDAKLTPDEVKAAERNLKKVPSIMPD